MTSWRTRAACLGTNPALFFPAGYGYASNDRRTTHRVSQAKAICNTCPVTKECLAYAITTNQTEGIWGGATPGRRRKLAKEAA